MDDAELPPHSRDFKAVARLINSQADIRLVTMIGAGYIERYLVDLLRHRLPGITPALEKTIWKQSLTGVSRRIDLGEALGAIQPAVAADLRTVINIRNRFAHHVDCTDCDHPTIGRLIGDLQSIDQSVIAAIEGSAITDTPENRLRAVIIAMIVGLHQLVEEPYA